MKVRVASLTNTNAWAKAGLMIRYGLEANSPNVFMMATPGPNGYRFTYRTTPGGSTIARGTGIVSYPNTWVRIVRQGDVVSGYRSSDGQAWVLVASARLTLPDTAYVGMALTSHNVTAMGTAQFRDLAVTTSTTPVPPAAPATLSATAVSASRIDLAWAASAGATSYLVERKGPGDANFVQVASNVIGTSYQDATGLSAATTYAYRVRAMNAAGASAYSPTATATTQPNPTVPGRLTGTDIGNPALAGSTQEITPGRDYNITAGGTDISGTFDQFHFAHRMHSGNFDLKVRVQSVVQRDPYTKVGIMARAGLGANSANVMSLLMPSDKGHRLQFRRTDGAITEASGSGVGVAVLPNAWLRLRRVGDVFTAFKSTDGVTWTTIKSLTIMLPQDVYLGLAVTSHNASATTVAELRDFGNV